MLLKSLPAKTVVQNVRTELLAEKASEKSNIKDDGTKMRSKKCIRKNSSSKCSFWKARGKSVRENYL